MALLNRGRLFAGALFAGALFGGTQLIPPVVAPGGAPTATTIPGGVQWGARHRGLQGGPHEIHAPSQQIVSYNDDDEVLMLLMQMLGEIL